MSKNLFNKLSPLAAFATQAFAAAGLDLEAMAATGDVQALKSAMAAQSGAAEAIAQATATLQAEVDAAAPQLALLATYQAALPVKATDAKAGIQSTDIAAAIEARASLKAAELLATTGTPPVGMEAKASVATAPKLPANLTGIDRVRAFFAAGGK